MKDIYNLQFPSYCDDLTIFGYRFTRKPDYSSRVKKLQHLVTVHSELTTGACTGSHVITAQVNPPDPEPSSVFEWLETKRTALDDILHLLSIFTRRDVFTVDDQSSPIIADPRIYTWGGELLTSLLKNSDVASASVENLCDRRFESGINGVYELVREDGWKEKYAKGHFLLLLKPAFRRQIIESSFILCWSIWEHLFAILNRRWLSDNQIRQMGATEKISFLFVEYKLVNDVDSTTRKGIEQFAQLRNRLIHFGKIPEGMSSDDIVLFIRLTEFISAKILNLGWSNIFNTVEALKEFLQRSGNTRTV